MLVLMEFAEHGSLLSLLKTREVNADQRLLLARDCCRGLRHLHERGFVHRDIAARNVLLSSDYG